MNFAQTTYEELVKLTNESEAFYFKDFELDSKVYRIFNYRLASWTLFESPSALNCRGTMFDVTQTPTLVSLPPEKFFNYEEGGVDHTVGLIGCKMVKMDGSLISTYLHNGELYLKTKGSLFSSQAFDAMKLLLTDKYSLVKEELLLLAKNNFTVNLEYTSPENRIVVPYQSEELTLLSLRSHIDGTNYFGTSLLEKLDDYNCVNLKSIIVGFEVLNVSSGHDDFVDLVRKEQEGEGYVVEIKTPNCSYLTKIKNLKYVTLHQTKDSVNSSKALFEAIIEETTDDLRSMFADDNYVLNKISEMENVVQPIFNHIVSTVETFYKDNKGLDRKSFAIKAKEEKPEFMGLIMNAYIGREIDYKDFAKKHRKDIFGISDVVTNLEEVEISALNCAKP